LLIDYHHPGCTLSHAACGAVRCPHIRRAAKSAGARAPTKPKRVWGEPGRVARSPSSAYKVRTKAKHVDRFRQTREGRLSHRRRRPGFDRSTNLHGMKPAAISDGLMGDRRLQTRHAWTSLLIPMADPAPRVAWRRLASHGIVQFPPRPHIRDGY
jgi:hypothetical protein